MVLVNLFMEFLKIGAFSFGGGMATLPYVYEMAEKTNWISKESITNILYPLLIRFCLSYFLLFFSYIKLINFNVAIDK